MTSDQPHDWKDASGNVIETPLQHEGDWQPLTVDAADEVTGESFADRVTLTASELGAAIQAHVDREHASGTDEHECFDGCADEILDLVLEAQGDS
jgi:hypothetical protein